MNLYHLINNININILENRSDNNFKKFSIQPIEPFINKKLYILYKCYE